jgi:hypothetical protein
MLKTAPREKVLRLSLASLKTLATLDDFNHNSNNTRMSMLSPSGDSNAEVTRSSAIFVREMIGCDVLKSLEMLQLRQWNDPDLQDDLDILHDIIVAHTKELTQWKVYQAEVETGVLRWSSLLHTEDFFRNNVRSMEGRHGDFEPVKRLVNILYRNTTSGRLRSSAGSKTYYIGLKAMVVKPGNEVHSLTNGNSASIPATNYASWDEEDIHDDELCETLAVCLYDIGQFARYYPNGRAVFSAAARHQQSLLGITKELVMQYMRHPRPEIQQQALSCASKMLLKSSSVAAIANDT